LGVLGVAVATAIFPLLSRHAARGDHRRLGDDLSLGIRLVLLLGIPAGAGLIVLAQPLAEMLFQHGRFTAEDTNRTARMIACYAAGVWAYCALPVIVRGYYAMGDRLTPVRVGLAAVALNLTLNLSLIWPLAEKGLALATAISASFQVVMLAILFSRYKSPLDWTAVTLTLLRTLFATLLMAAAGYATLWAIRPGQGLYAEIVRVAVPLAVAVIVFSTTFWVCGGSELRMLLDGRTHHRSRP
jgi:putative peptidoglycan lipid II flippase